MKFGKLAILVLVLLGCEVCAAWARVQLLPDFIDNNPFEFRKNSSTETMAEEICHKNGGMTQAQALSAGKNCSTVFVATEDSKTVLCYKNCTKKW